MGSSVWGQRSGELQVQDEGATRLAGKVNVIRKRAARPQMRPKTERRLDMKWENDAEHPRTSALLWLNRSCSGEKTEGVKRKKRAPLFIQWLPAESDNLTDPLKLPKETSGSRKRHRSQKVLGTEKAFQLNYHDMSPLPGILLCEIYETHTF